MTCHICGDSPTHPIASHLIPASYLVKLMGKRNNEYMFGLSPYSGIEEFYGKDNKSNKDPHIKELPLAPKNIFCKKCEDALAKWEGMCTGPLLQFNELVNTGKITLKQTEKGLSYAELTSLSPDVLRFFFYTLVWRELLMQQLHGGKVHHVQLFAALKEILNRHLHEPIGRDWSLSKEDYPLISLYTTIHQEQVINLVNPQHLVSDPAVFFVGPYNALVWGEWKAPHDRNIPEELNQEIFQLNHSGIARIPVISMADWMKPLQEWERHNIVTMQYPMYRTMARTLNISIMEAITRLQNRTAEIAFETNKPAVASFYLAYKELMAGTPFEQRADTFEPTPPVEVDVNTVNEDQLIDYISAIMYSPDYPRMKKYFSKIAASTNEKAKAMLKVLFQQLAEDYLGVVATLPQKIKSLQLAIEHLEMTLQFSSKDPVVLMQLGIAEFQLGTLTRKIPLQKKGITSLEKSKMIDASLGQDFELGTFYRQLASTATTKSNYYTLSQRHFEQSIDACQRVEESLILLAYEKAERSALGGFSPASVADADEAFKKAVDGNGDDAELHYQRGLFFYHAADRTKNPSYYRSAIEYFSTSVTVHEYANTYYMWGVCLSNFGQLGDLSFEILRNAIRKYERAIQINEIHADSIYSSAVLKMKLVNWHEEPPTELEEVERRLKKVIEIEPNFALAYNQAGNVLRIRYAMKKEDVQQLEEAKKMFEEAITRKHPKFEPTCNLGHVSFELAEATGEKKHFQQCVEYYTAALRLTTTDYMLLHAIQFKLSVLEAEHLSGLEALKTLYRKGLGYFRKLSPQQLPVEAQQFPMNFSD